MGSSQTGRRFYVGMGLALILLSILGFTPFMYARFASGGTMSMALVAHGISFFAWLALFTYQASLVRAKNLKKHMKLGQASVGLALIVLASGVVVTGEVFARGDASATPFSPEQFIMLPLMDITIFVVYYTLAIMNRKVPETHKRLMLLVGIMMMDPATGRLGFTLGFPPIGMLFHFGLIAAMCIYDRRTLGQVHKVSWVALAVLTARYAAFFIIGPTEAWAAFTHWLLG
ncbi:hypothetical protein [Kordiimonas lacus]|uniref:Uncharacterized protein n=1 Tax=Kordiimonas lacus TaxID=637679 RepID=A0A1G6Y0V0_9PROT|nr:hypothetical protein [Kordiimonas lacus]SDD83940.1 hypothetical protein SAMN04488071_1439 [Kordiimonas lacus]